MFSHLLHALCVVALHGGLGGLELGVAQHGGGGVVEEQAADQVRQEVRAAEEQLLVGVGDAEREQGTIGAFVAAPEVAPAARGLGAQPLLAAADNQVNLVLGEAEGTLVALFAAAVVDVLRHTNQR